MNVIEHNTNVKESMIKIKGARNARKQFPVGFIVSLAIMSQH